MPWEFQVGDGGEWMGPPHFQTHSDLTQGRFVSHSHLVSLTENTGPLLTLLTQVSSLEEASSLMLNHTPALKDALGSDTRSSVHISLLQESHGHIQPQGSKSHHPVPRGRGWKCESRCEGHHGQEYAQPHSEGWNPKLLRTTHSWLVPQLPLHLAWPLAQFCHRAI